MGSFATLYPLSPKKLASFFSYIFSILFSHLIQYLLDNFGYHELIWLCQISAIFTFSVIIYKFFATPNSVEDEFFRKIFHNFFDPGGGTNDQTRVFMQEKQRDNDLKKVTLLLYSSVYIDIYVFSA